MYDDYQVATQIGFVWNIFIQSDAPQLSRSLKSDVHEIDEYHVPLLTLAESEFQDGCSGIMKSANWFLDQLAKNGSLILVAVNYCSTLIHEPAQKLYDIYVSWTFLIR